MPEKVLTIQKPSPDTGTVNRFIPYGRQNIDDSDISAVTDVLRSDWITQGPVIERFEKALSGKVGSDYAAACSSGTAALHLAMLAAGIGPGDTVVTSTNSFLSSANCARLVGADVRFTDIEPTTGLMDIASLSELLRNDTSKKIKAIIPVHFAGQPADLTEIAKLVNGHGAVIIEDACHALGAAYEIGSELIKIGSCNHSDMTVFSFHPVKHITTGEGGAVTTNSSELAERLKILRSHGMVKSGFQNMDMAYAPDGSVNPWYYEMRELGLNYRITDLQAALGLSQLTKLDRWLDKRNELANLYNTRIADNFDNRLLSPLDVSDNVRHAYHLFVVRIDFREFGVTRASVMNGLRERGIGTQVHYIPIHLQPYYKKHFRTEVGKFPGAEKYYEKTLTLPLYAELTRDDIYMIVNEIKAVLNGN